MKARLPLWLATLALPCLLGSGCAIEHLSDNTGQALRAMMAKQTTVRLTDLDAPQKMDAEDAEFAQQNKKQDRKKGMLGGSGPRVLNLAR